jgi:hypothetical protein
VPRTKDFASNSSTKITIPDVTKGFWIRCPYCNTGSGLDMKAIVWSYTADKMCECSIFGQGFDVFNATYHGLDIGGEHVSYMKAMVKCRRCNKVTFFREIIDVNCACGESYRWLLPHIRQRR